MELSTNTISKVIIESLTNRQLYNLVKRNIDGYFKFCRSHQDISLFSGIIEYINKTEFDDFNSLNLNALLRSKSISEGTLTDLLGSVDYLRSINIDKPILPESVVLLKSIFYSGHYEEVQGKTYDEIFEYCRNVTWISDYVDPRFVIEDISSNYDIDQVTALLSPEGSIKSSLPFVNESSPNKGYFPNELVTVSAAPGTGKTQFVLTEALNFIKQGKRVLYIALGDMVNYLITIRLMCMHMRISPGEAFMNLKDYLNEFRENEEIKNNFKFVVLESNKVTAQDVFNFLSVMNESYDVWMVDYDGNFAPQTDNLYKEGGTAYDYAINVCRNFNKLGFILSQPKIQYWTSEALGKECLAESSRKQQITDTILTFGIRVGCNNRCGYSQLVKRRNGDFVFNIPWAAAESGQIIQVDTDMYGELISSPNKVKLQVNEVGGLDLPSEYLDTEPELLNENDT